MSDVTVSPAQGPAPEAGQLMTSQEALIHAFVGAQYGDLEFDVGKSVHWVEWFCDDVFITDVNLGTQRYWIVNWTETFPHTHHVVTGVNYFYDTVAFRKQQFVDAQKQGAILLEPDDWVIFLDAHEGLCLDTRPPLPNDFAVEPFRSYLYREITRANAAGKDRIVLPFYVFLRHDHIVNVEYPHAAFVQEITGSTTARHSMGTPYYLPYQGLTRMMKVKVLQDPSFNWSTIDQPSAWDVKPGTGGGPVSAHLNPAVGQVSTPHAIPQITTGTYRLSMNCQIDATNSAYLYPINKQQGAPARIDYQLMMVKYNDHYAFVASKSADLNTNAFIFGVTPIVYGGVHTIAQEFTIGSTVSASLLDGVSTVRTSDFAIGAPNAAVPIVIGDSNIVGKIYWAQLEKLTGPGGTQTSLLWRFDAAERTGTGTSYVDPRGRTWTFTNVNAFVPTSAALPAVPAVNTSIVSYAYAHWNLQDIEPPQTTVPPLDANNDDGWRMRNLMSRVRPISGIPYDSDPNVHGGYLTPTVGLVSSPDPGPITTDLTLTARIRKTDFTTSAYIATHPDAWTLWFYDGYLIFSHISNTGVNSTEYVMTPEQTLASFPPGQDLRIGVKFQRNDGTGRTQAVAITSADGITWTPIGGPPVWATPNPAVTAFADVAGPMYVGSPIPLVDRIYSAEMRTGLNPTGGTLLWRFDANDYSGVGTSYTDPRNRTWTLSSAASITLDWKPPNTDPAGLAGPWAPADAMTPDPIDSNGQPMPQPVTPDPTLAGLLVPLYDNVLRLNMRDGVYYEGDQLGNIPLEWDDYKQTWVARDMTPKEWHDTEDWVAPA